MGMARFFFEGGGAAQRWPYRDLPSKPPADNLLFGCHPNLPAG